MDILKVKVNNEWVAIPSITGPRGIGIQSITKTNTQGLVDTYTILFSDGNSTTFNISNGAVPSFTIGTVTEGPTAAVTVTGTDTNPVLNLTLPNANVPTAVSELNNDAGYATESYVNTVISSVNTMKIHICTAAEYNSETGVPTIANPDTQTFYLVPGGEGNNLFIEWAYVNNAWERFGSADVDLSNYVQKTDYATSSTAGIVRVRQTYGLTMDNDTIKVFAAPSSHIKAGAASYTSIVPNNQHESAFYGLAKAAGDTTQSQSDNVIGTYTNEAKAAIQQMLDVPSNSDMSAYATKADTVLETTLSLGRKTETTVGLKSVAIGLNVVASGKYSHGEGASTIASAIASHAEGSFSKATGPNSHAEGYVTEANHANTHAEGYHTKANGGYSRVSGKYNVPDNLDDINDWVPNQQYEVGDKVKKISLTSGTDLLNVFVCTQANNDEEFDYSKWQTYYEYHYADIVGNGTANTRSNAYALDWDGNGHYAGDVYVHANADSTGGTKLAKITDIPSVPVQDVRVNGTSVVSGGVANVPLAVNRGATGVVKINQSFGITETAGILTLVETSIAEAKTGTSQYRAVLPSIQHASAFYGLAKAAGADEKNSTLPVGQYTDAAKAAIQSMLGVSQMLAPVNPNMTAAQAYGVGDVFAANGKLYKATAAIAQDAAIIPDTNCEETTMADESVRDVQVGEHSIVDAQGIAQIPYASTGAYGGLIRYRPNRGLIMSTDGYIAVDPATSSLIKAGTAQSWPIDPMRQHVSVFYGLSKVAGVDLKDETVTLGTYPEASKTAIKAMLGIQDGSTGTVDITGTTPTITAVENTRYVCGEVSTLSFTPAVSGTCIVRFTSGSTATVLTLPSTVKFPEWFDATALETDTIYELCVTDGIYGAVMSWAL